MHSSTAIALSIATTAFLFFIGDTAAGDGRYASCDAYLPKARKVLGQDVGPESCLMRTAELNYMGRGYVRVDMGLDGTAEGYVKEEGPYHEYLTNVPELTFAQAATPGEQQLAIARYERLRGSAILLVYPKSRADWNGKLWVTAHGRGRSFRNGRLRIWDRYYDADDPVAAFDKIDRVMIAKGYALAKTLRTSEQDIGEVIAQLEDGSIVDFTAFNDNAAIIKDFALIAENAMQKRLGRKPARTYLYGHSAGARIARGLNYARGLNSDVRGQPIFDGYLLDDSATGLWLPVMMQDGKDVLLQTDEDKAAPGVEVQHVDDGKACAVALPLVTECR